MIIIETHNFTDFRNVKSVFVCFRTFEVLDVIEMPIQVITGLAFGEPKLKTLFVLSASLPVDIYTGQSSNQSSTDSAGSMFMVKGLKTKGYSDRRFGFNKQTPKCS